ncbi:hypothetical protein M407DRAFT_7047 [Tulasnella calospora MUT 4182]|uniref:H/ACA ribonucleoprotein complex non-core subunit NAF1 n=1 Tax=Tulasnella calospora MUT 4182 TaxID=1051891 RepID=A0A0C3M2L1_9AGAM|nr:hypothetical protein M407DRAFT_7047 [Tulasnella calospora MUT 4182]
MEQFIFEENLSILDEDRDGAGEEADIEALLLPSEPRAPSPSTAPSDLPRAPPHQQAQIKPIARLESSQSMNSTSNSQGAQIAGLPPDIAAILDMVTISGTQEPQHQQAPTTPSSPVNEPIKLPSDDAGLLPAAISAQAAGTDPADETSDSSSSDWDSSASSESEEDEAEDRPNKQTRPPPRPKLGDSDDDDEVGGRTHSAPLKTANEVVDPNVAPPSIEKVGDDERLEIIGEVMSIIGSVVVVKGLPGSAAEKVLDTGSLLVWDDRHVLGEVFETFGPTHLPLYSIRLPSSPSSSVFTVGRKVYHIPTRSNYVFTRSLAFIRGSDASNQHDEEVGEDEIEFSDDEKETEWKRQRKMKRQTSVRPSPSVRDDGDWEYSSSSAYHDPGAAVGGSSGVTAGPSTPRRAPPAPYDESMDLPYEDQEVSTQDDDAMSVSSSLPETNYNRGRGFSRGRGGRGRGARDRGRGRGRGGRGGFRGGMPPPSNPSINRHHDNPPPQFGGTSTDEYDPPLPTILWFREPWDGYGYGHDAEFRRWE